ncbi:MAG: hypothetical protein WC662_01055 [Candidatus Paceibacterota bacterium]|jgi:hypothetical protein
MNPEEKLTWSALEYEEKERSNDWFWALGVIVVAGSITSIIFANYFFAILIIIGGVLLGFFAIKKPEIVPYELNEKGFKIKTRLFSYDTIKSFWVQKEPKYTLFVKSSRQFLPILSIPITEELSQKIKEILISKKITEEEMREHPSDKIMESLGF